MEENGLIPRHITVKHQSNGDNKLLNMFRSQKHIIHSTVSHVYTHKMQTFMVDLNKITLLHIKITLLHKKLICKSTKKWNKWSL